MSDARSYFTERPSGETTGYMRRLLRHFIDNDAKRLIEAGHSGSIVPTFVGQIESLLELEDALGDDLLAVLTGHAPEEWRRIVAAGKAVMDAQAAKLAAEKASR